MKLQANNNAIEYFKTKAQDAIRVFKAEQMYMVEEYFNVKKKLMQSE